MNTNRMRWSEPVGSIHNRFGERSVTNRQLETPPDRKLDLGLVGRTKDDDRRPETGIAKLYSFVDRRDAKKCRSCVDRGSSNRGCPMSVGVGLDDGHDARIGAQGRTNDGYILGDCVEVDDCSGGPAGMPPNLRENALIHLPVPQPAGGWLASASLAALSSFAITRMRSARETMPTNSRSSFTTGTGLTRSSTINVASCPVVALCLMLKTGVVIRSRAVT